MQLSYVLSSLVLGMLSTAAHASSEHDLYSKIFSVHAEFCSLTQIKPVGLKAGGPGGHAILYLHGMCKDQTVGYPKVVPCSEVPEADRLHDGVGISVDNDFRNVNWVAVPGYDLFMHGFPSEGDVVDQEALSRVVRRSVGAHVFRGVKFNIDSVNPDLHSSSDYERQVTLAAIGTDLAIQYGREMRCVRLPIPEAKLKPIARYLNEVNEPYLSGKKVYEWSAIYNNCAHLSANILSVAGVRTDIKTDLNFFKQLANIGVPRNGLATVQEIAHRKNIDFNSVKSDKLRWKALNEDQYLATGFGGLSSFHPVFQKNHFYKTDLKAVHIPQIPTFDNLGMFTRSRQALKDSNFNSLKQSARYWLGQYQEVLADSKDKSASKDLTEYQQFIRGEIKRTAAALKFLKSVN